METSVSRAAILNFAVAESSGRGCLHVRIKPVKTRLRSRNPLRPLLTGGLMLLTCGCVSRDVARYMGQDPHLVFPASQLVDQSLMQADDAHPGADWGLSLVWEGDHYLLSADQNITPGAPSQTWRVRALQRITLLDYDQMFALGSCKRGEGPFLSRVVAVVNYDHSKQWFDSIREAWAFDPVRTAFVPYPTQGLRCLNRLYGTDLTPPSPFILAPVTNAAPTAATARPPSP